MAVFTCFKDDCIARVKQIQISNFHLPDIPFNFLIGGDGIVYEGRGFEFQTFSNESGISVVFIVTIPSAYFSTQQGETLKEASQKDAIFLVWIIICIYIFISFLILMLINGLM
jgi:hypothetical protein